MRYNFNKYASLLFTLMLSAACSGEEATLVPLTLAEDKCDKDALEDVDSLEVLVISNQETQRSKCLNVKFQALAEVQKTLREQMSFADVSSGEITIIIRGYNHGECKSENLILCGAQKFVLPTTQASINIPLGCDKSSDPSDDFKNCAVTK